MSLSGKVISPDGELIEGPHKVGLEIVGGFLLLKAENLDEAVQITQSCPIFEFGGYAEVRELNS